MRAPIAARVRSVLVPYVGVACHRARRARAVRHVVTTLHVRRAARDSRRACSAGTRRGTATSRTAVTTASPPRDCASSRCSRCSAARSSWLPGVDAGFGVVVRRERVRARARIRPLPRSRCTNATIPSSRRRAVWLVYLVPPSFVLVMGYAEATFMTFAARRPARDCARGGGGSRRSPVSSPDSPGRSVCCSRSRPRSKAGRRRDAEGRRRRRDRRPLAGSARVSRLGRAPHARLLVPAAHAAGPDAARPLGRSGARRRAHRARAVRGRPRERGHPRRERARVRRAARRARSAAGRCRSRCTPRRRSSSRSAATTSTRSSATASRRFRSCSPAPTSPPTRPRARRAAASPAPDSSPRPMLAFTGVLVP